MIPKLLVCIGALVELLSLTLSSPTSEPNTSAAFQVGNQACARCHQEIYRSYSRTPMAQTSGLIGDHFVPGSFTHRLSSVHYQIYQENGKVFLSYERPHGAQLRGKQELTYFIGSGTRGRSYLFDINGFLFQSPVSYYSREKKWDLSPGYESYPQMPFNRAIDESCLVCHVSQLAHREGTQNGFQAPAFAQDGVGCERCHGPGSEHVQGKGGMINPARLPAERRDSICAQCHLSGESRISKPGKTLAQFRPGNLLSDYVTSFIYAGNAKEKFKAISHVESLAQSLCKIRSGDGMSCLSCHDPHTTPQENEKAAWYRGKCLSCHLAAKPAPALQQHFDKNLNCVNCHMPRAVGLSIGHTTLTDHRIQRKPIKNEAGEKRIVPFGSAQSDPRGLGLAYAELAARDHDPFEQAQALENLTRALKTSVPDAEVMARLAFLRQQNGEEKQAATLYEKALALDPHEIVALVNLGVLYANQQKPSQAMKLWHQALESNPGLTEASIDLALELAATGNRPEARRVIQEALRYDPDSDMAQQVLHKLGD